MKPRHVHIRDQLQAVIRAGRDDMVSDELIANRCVHVLVLLDVLPEVPRHTEAK